MFEYVTKAASGIAILRFIFPPTMAIFLGIRAGKIDAKLKIPLYLNQLFFAKNKRVIALKKGLKHIVIVLVVATVADSIIQYTIYGYWRLQIAIVVGLFTIFVPYVLARSVTNRIMRRVKSD